MQRRISLALIGVSVFDQHSPVRVHSICVELTASVRPVERLLTSQVNMHWSTLLAVAAVADAAPTMLRFGCSQVVIDRIDPLVNPDQAPSPHLHQVVGGNAFNLSMPSTDIAQLATCTTCSYADDFSNYWTANMYFRARNGSFKRIPQVPNRLLFGDRFTTKTTGGFVVYYVSPGKAGVTAFKPASLPSFTIYRRGYLGGMLTFTGLPHVGWRCK